MEGPALLEDVRGRLRRGAPVGVCGYGLLSAVPGKPGAALFLTRGSPLAIRPWAPGERRLNSAGRERLGGVAGQAASFLPASASARSAMACCLRRSTRVRW